MFTIVAAAIAAGIWKVLAAIVAGCGAALGMALVKAPAGGVAASGTIGGQVYARNRAGNYARAWAKPVNPRTARQTQVRNSFAANSVAWGLLTQAQVDAWDAYAAQLTRFNRLGEPYTPKGRQIFVETNTNLTLVAMPAMDVPANATDSPGFVINDPFVSTLTVVANAITLQKLSAASSVVLPGGDTGHYVIDATPPLDPKITNPQRYFRFVTIKDDATLTDDISADYNSTFGNPFIVAGQNIWYRVRLVDDVTGLSSPQQIGSGPTT